MSLNPVFRIGYQIKEALELHRPAAASDSEVVRLLELVGVSAAVAGKLSARVIGRSEQRVMIAMALAPQPKLLVADEPTTALDVTVQAQIIELLQELQERLDMAILLISHNLGIVGDLADHVAVMYAGQIVESAPTMELWSQPLHPYTRALIDSVPAMDQQKERLTDRGSWRGPSVGRIAARLPVPSSCPRAIGECSQNPPALIEPRPGRWTRCPLWNATGVHAGVA